MSVPVPRIGVFGGLFNPPHIGHLSLCQEAAWQLGLERVVLVPTGRPSHRAAPAESPELRLRLAQAAALGNPIFTVSRLEVDRVGPSYTVDTLRELTSRYPGSSLHLLVGADQLVAMEQWHEARAIPQLARLAAALRPGVDVASIGAANLDWVEMPQIGVSSSLVRARVRAGRPIRYFVPDAVRELIDLEGLYRHDAAETGDRG
ncbi:MAG: nicotinate-nucleotide adenylyltransferase [Gaiellales bacterium]